MDFPCAIMEPVLPTTHVFASMGTQVMDVQRGNVSCM